MRTRRALLVMGCCVVLLSMAGSVVAAPTPPLTAVNEETKECGMMLGGDECTNCYPINGWTLLGNGVDVECPDGYVSGEPEYACDHFKAQHCCTEGHSGASGDCEDLIISHRYDQCAFVDDINTCEPPREWTQRPSGSKAEEWLCPTGYEWVDGIDCSAAESTPAATAEAPEGTSLFCLGVPLMGPALLVLWLVIRRNA
jgi:hypothetical protein